MLDLDPAGQDGQFGHGRGLLEVDTVVHRHPRLEVRELDENLARFAPETLEFGHALPGGAGRPAFQPKKNEGREERENQEDECNNGRPSQPPRGFAGHGAVWLRLHQPKKVPPSTPEGHEGRLFPPEQSFKSEAEIPDLTSACKKKILAPSGK